MGLSLWIVPNSEDSELIKLIMEVRPVTRTMSASGPLTQESYPKFHPHITLASLPLSMETSLDAIDSVISKIKVPPICIFASVDVGSEYYRSVYVAIQLTSEINSLHKFVHEALNVVPRTPSFPHMSLCYITNTDADAGGQREKYRQALEESGKVRSIEVDNDSKGVILCPRALDFPLDHFVAHEIWAVRCEGPVESWVVLRHFSLPELP